MMKKNVENNLKLKALSEIQNKILKVVCKNITAKIINRTKKYTPGN